MKRAMFKDTIRWLICVFIVVTVFLPVVPVHAATVIIAANDSDAAWKAAATVVCNGVADQFEINTYLITGNTVELAPGTYYISDAVLPQTSSRLYGQGSTSVLNLTDTAIYMENVSNVELDHFNVSGSISGGIGAAIFFASHTANTSNYSVHDISINATGENDFTLYANNGGNISNVSFVRCNAVSPDGFGFIIDGEGSPSTVTNVTFYRSTVLNAGVAATRNGDWVTGFDIAEYQSVNLTVNKVRTIACGVNGAWESDFHMEGVPIKNNVIYLDSYATNAGQKTGGAVYGAGFLVDGDSDIIMFGNTAGTNGVADMRVWNGAAYDDYTPPVNLVRPVGSVKTTADVATGNAAGVIVTNSTYKDVYLYSSDNNTVNQQIELGGYYAANDGGSYTFSGTKLVASFTDYAVYGLVQTSAPATPTPPLAGDPVAGLNDTIMMLPFIFAGVLFLISWTLISSGQPIILVAIFVAIVLIIGVYLIPVITSAVVGVVGG